MTKQAKIKCSTAAYPHASDLMAEMLGNGRRLLGPEPGAEYVETVCGHKLIAYRLECGGVEVREVGRLQARAVGDCLQVGEVAA